MADIKPKLIDAFGASIEENNKINRSTLGDIVFNNKAELLKLNTIVHPKICDEVNRIIQSTTKQVIIVEGALIHQVGLEHVCNHTIALIRQPRPF